MFERHIRACCAEGRQPQPKIDVQALGRQRSGFVSFAWSGSSSEQSDAANDLDGWIFELLGEDLTQPIEVVVGVGEDALLVVAVHHRAGQPVPLDATVQQGCAEHGGARGGRLP